MFPQAGTNLALLTAYVLVSVIGLHFLKTSAGTVLSVPFVLGLSCYGAGFALWYLMLTSLPLSVAFPLAAGALIVGSQLVGHFLLGETLAARHLLGVLLIVIGITVVLPRGA
jgi:multidrug transporter EmrE-like cation transporter